MIVEISIALLLMLISYEAKSWFPHLIDRLILIAARGLPRRHRRRYFEEWQALIDETPGAVKRLFCAYDLRRGARSMYPLYTARIQAVRARQRKLSEIALLDRAVGLVCVIIYAPLLIFLLTATRIWGGPGPTMFRQVRRLRNGRDVVWVKFRTLGIASDGSEQTNMTAVGQFLRRTHLDQLPNILSIARGDLSLIDMCVQDEGAEEFKRAPSVRRYFKLIVRTIIIANRRSAA